MKTEIQTVYEKILEIVISFFSKARKTAKLKKMEFPQCLCTFFALKKFNEHLMKY